jgi:mRNA interferase MazF
MVIRQGDVFWIDLGEAEGSGPALRRPCVVIQNDVFNASRLQTVIVCMLTSNPRRASDVANVTLECGEAGLSKPSVVNVSQVMTVDKEELSAFIGRLSAVRVQQILAGLRLMTEPLYLG